MLVQRIRLFLFWLKKNQSVNVQINYLFLKEESND